MLDLRDLSSSVQAYLPMPNKINVICANMREILKRNKRIIGLPYTVIYRDMHNMFEAPICLDYGGIFCIPTDESLVFPSQLLAPRDGIDAADTLGQHSVGNQF